MSAVGRYSDTEPLLRIIADMAREVSDTRRSRLAVVAGETVVRMAFSDFAHGLGKCPSCGKPVDNRDVTERIWDHPLPGPRPLGAHLVHERCGAIFRIEFER